MERLPAFTLKWNTFDFSRNIKLADPQFHMSSKIDFLIGAEIFWELLGRRQIKAFTTHPALQKTRLEWIIAGRLNYDSQPASKVLSCHAAVSNARLHSALDKFCRLDSTVNRNNGYTIEENVCDRDFFVNVRRNE